MKLLIFIPARKGSKEIKNKNMILIKKKPLIYYTIKTAKNIKLSAINK
jgi:CMP-N-acetylneuraminic acid synthetase